MEHQVGEEKKEEEMREAFNEFDIYKTGRISATIITYKLHTMGEDLSYCDVVDMIREVDSDGDNYITFEEFKQLMG